MALVIKGSSSGQVTLDVPAAAGTNTITIPATTGTMLDTNSVIASNKLPTGSVIQTVSSTDNLSYSITVSSATSDHAGSKAYTITPSSTSSSIVIHFTIPQVKQSAHAGLRVRLYRDIGGAGYAHVSGLDGDSASNRQGGLFGNYDTNGDGNRSATTITGTVVDSPNTTSAVSYKFYFGTGDGTSADPIYVNRTQNDADFNYTHRTRTHVTLMEIAG